MLLFKKALKKIFVILVCVLFLMCGALFFVYTFSTPKNDRDWTLDQQVLPSATFNGDFVTIKNIRNFSYTSETEYTPQYYDKTYTISDLVSVDFIVEPLAPIAIAHTFVSFGFKNGDYLAVSVEIRKEKGESFSPTKGLLNQFELMYVIADERDVIKLRTLYRKDMLYLYPALVTQEKIQALFRSMLLRANALTENPEFYNTLTNTCTTNIVDHINEISERNIPWDYRILLPKDSDEFAYELGLIDTSIPFSEVREKYEINKYVEEFQNESNFSQKIREHLQ